MSKCDDVRAPHDEETRATDLQAGRHGGMKIIPSAILILASTLFVPACVDQKIGDPSSDDTADSADDSVELSTLGPAVESGELAGFRPVVMSDLPENTVFHSDAVAAAFSCPSGYVCLFQNKSYGGNVLAIQAGIGVVNLRQLSCPGCQNGKPGSDGTWNDQMTSWQNHSSRHYCWYFNASFGGETHAMKANWNVGEVTAHENDNASSIRPCT
jgi:hypothetical protein